MQQILPTGSSRHESGFTLLELMLVVLVVGLMSSAIAFSVPSESTEHQLKRYSFHTRLFLRNLQQQAVYSGKEIGVLMTSDKLIALQYEDNGWKKMKNNPPHDLLADTNWSLGVEELQFSTLPSGISTNTTPQIIFFSDGQYTDFHFEIVKQNIVFTFEGLFENASK